MATNSHRKLKSPGHCLLLKENLFLVEFVTWVVNFYNTFIDINIDDYYSAPLMSNSRFQVKLSSGVSSLFGYVSIANMT